MVFFVVLFLLIEICGRLASIELEHDRIGLTQSSMSQPHSKLSEGTEKRSATFMTIQKIKCICLSN